MKLYIDISECYFELFANAQHKREEERNETKCSLHENDIAVERNMERINIEIFI